MRLGADGQFLNRFDVVSSEVAEEALLSVFVTRPEVFESIEFPGKSTFVYVGDLVKMETYLLQTNTGHP